MSRTENSTGDRMLRWYPASWRARYGDEFTALMEDSFGQAPVPWRTQVSTARAGLTERLRASGLGGEGQGAGHRTRSGALLVLCGWGPFVVAGAIFAKFAEQWDVGTPRPDRWLPSAAYDAVQWSAVAGLAIVLLATLAVLPSLVALVRRAHWSSIRGPITRTVGAGTITLLVGAGVVVWAHHLNAHQRNGGQWSYSVAVVVFAGLIAATLAVGIVSAVTLTNRLTLSVAVLRTLGGLALALTTIMMVIVAGTVTWWVALAIHAPSVLSEGAASSGTVIPPPLALAGLLMVLGATTGVFGASRVGRAASGLSKIDQL